jgi:hypothetical protein
MAIRDLNIRVSDDMDKFAFRLMPDAEQERMADFAKGKFETLIAFGDTEVPGDLLEAAQYVREQASERIDTDHTDFESEEFTLGVVMTAYALRRQPQ